MDPAGMEKVVGYSILSPFDLSLDKAKVCAYPATAAPRVTRRSRVFSSFTSGDAVVEP